MSSLTEISVYTRKILIWILVAIVALFFLRTIVDIAIKVIYTKPAETVPPIDTLFDKIPSPVFDSSSASSGFNFTLLNIEGRPPETTSAGKVYSMPKKLPSLLASSKAKTFAQKLGFTSDPIIITSTYYRFYDLESIGRTLELDIINMNFKLNYDYQKHPELFKDFPFILEDNAISQVNRFVKSKALFDQSLLTGNTKTELLRYNLQTKQFETASSLSTTHAIRIDFFRQNLDGLKLVTPKFQKSYIYAIYSPLKNIKEEILELEYSFWPIDSGNFGTYPLKNSDSAWQELIEGKATVINQGENRADNIIIRDIYLAYYDSSDPQVFLQPIFVFEGDNEFIAYLPAVLPDWLE